MSRAVVVLAGVALGVLSRVDETTASRFPVSDNATWVLAAVLAGAALTAVVLLTTANLAYYAWIALTEPGTPLGSVAGSPWHWLALGVLTGLVFGTVGARARRAAPPAAVALLAVPLLAIVLDRLDALALLMP